jgi:hypothetical protein
VGKDKDDQQRRFREQQRRKADEQRQRNLDAAAAEEQSVQRARDKSSDDEFLEGISGLFGGTDLKDLKDIDWVDDDAVKRRIREMQALQRKGKDKAAAEIYKRQRARIKKSVKRSSKKRDAEIKAGKKGKSKSGCAVVSVLIMGAALAAFGSAAGAAVELVEAMIR